MRVANLARSAALLLCAVVLGGCWESSGRLIPAHAQVPLPVRPGIYATTPEMGQVINVVKLEPGPRANSPLYTLWIGDMRATWQATMAQKTPTYPKTVLEIVPLDPGVFVVAEVRGITAANHASPEAESSMRSYAIVLVRPDGFAKIDGSCDPAAITLRNAALRSGAKFGSANCQFTSFDQLAAASREAVAVLRNTGATLTMYRYVAPL